MDILTGVRDHMPQNLGPSHLDCFPTFRYRSGCKSMGVVKNFEGHAIWTNLKTTLQYVEVRSMSKNL